MQKIKSSWFRFWASVLAFLGVAHSNDADAARQVVSVSCGGITETYNHATSENCKIVSENDNTNLFAGETINCYCDETTLMQYKITCTFTQRTDPDSEATYTYWQFDHTIGTCTAQCPIGTTRSCSTTSYNGTQECTLYGVWGDCKKTSCKNGYLLIDDVCYAECAIDGGEGYERVVNSESSSSTEA